MRALSTKEYTTLLLAAENQDGRAFPLNTNVRNKLLAAGLIHLINGACYITDTGRHTVRAQGNSGGR